MMLPVIVTTALALVTLTTADERANLIRNPSFEEEIGDTWSRSGRFTMTRALGPALHGKAALKCADRTKDLNGPIQTLPKMTPGRGYELRAYVKLLNDNPDKLWQQLKAVVTFQFGDPDKPSKRPPSCRGSTGGERKVCLKARQEWRQEMQRRKAAKRQAKKDRARAERERRKRRQRDKRKKKKKEKRDKQKKEEDKKKKKAEEKERKAEERKKKAEERKKKKKEAAKKAKQIKREKKQKEKAEERKRKAEERKKKAEERKKKKEAAKKAKQVEREKKREEKRRQRETRRRRTRRSGDRQSGPDVSSGSYIIAWRAFVTSEQGWVALVGDIDAPMKPFRENTLYIRGPDAGIDFLLDNVTLLEVPERSDWLAESKEMIDSNRKSDLTLKTILPAEIDPAEVNVQVKLKRHLFAFGSKVEDDLMRSSKAEDFRQLFYYLFNWATIGSFKWRFDKSPNLYQPDFSNAVEALDVLVKNGIKVRAHSILWGVKKNIPEMVLATPPEELPRLLKHHTEYMINITKGRVEHWDVQNEFLHGHWYEETMRDPTVSQRIFSLARPLDSHVKLYLNDFTAVTSGANTEDYHDTAERFIQAGTGIQGLGIQGHVKDFVKPSPTMIWKRLDRLAETGLDLFMTEFDIGWDNEEERADWFEDAMRAFFAHPRLNGVILWGFWRERQRYKNKYLVYAKNGNDDDLTFSEQGKRYVCLVKKEWTTQETLRLTEGRNFRLRAFQGEYEVVVRRNGQPVQRQTFTLGKRSETVTVKITESQERIDIGEDPDAKYLKMCDDKRK